MFRHLGEHVTQQQKEILAVTAVGFGLTALVRYVPVLSKAPLLAGTALYVGGYLVRQYKPAGGWPLLEG